MELYLVGFTIETGLGKAGYVLEKIPQLPLNEDHLHRDPDYPWEAYLQS